jgi:hypothetical protein
MRNPTKLSGSSALAELFCVDPKAVSEYWPHVKHLIQRAISRTDLNCFCDIEDAVLNGDDLLWIVWDGKKVLCAATTSLTITEMSKVCILTACGGEDMNQWIPLFSQIEAYAKAEKCKSVRIYGRRGWQRVLPEYHVKHVILERPL